MAGDLGSLYFALKLNDKEFNDAIDKAKERVAELTGEAVITATIKADADKVAAQVQEDLNKITGKKTEVKLGVDKSSAEQIKELVASIAEAEEDLKRFESAKAKDVSAINNRRGALENFKRQLAELRQVEVATNEANKSINEAAQSTQTIQHVVREEDIELVNKLTSALEKQNEQLELRNRLDQGKVDAAAKTKAEREAAKALADAKKEELEAEKALNNFINKAKRDRTSAKNQGIKETQTALQQQLALLFRLEEAIKRLQNLRVKLNLQGIDQNSENFRKAAAALDGYIDKLQQLQGSGRMLSKRKVSSVLGVDMKAAIDESNSYVKEQKAIEKSLIKAMSENSGVVVTKEKTSSMNKLKKAIMGTTNWATQLNNQLGNAFSIYAIERFIRNLYTVGGEFQKQQIALQNMIGDADKADVIFSRMKDLAVISPFTFSELASYTKRMSAYGIEYEELYDTTKRLADISAGVGVDMSRLILAYGQVKSAEVLRGQELRQFTEAGIPIVAELAKRLEEVRGKSVVIGEVFDAISRREISFGMVKDVLFDMTDPGGRFFETQERLAESLAGKWSNLKDAWGIMIADIANGNNSTLKGLADTTAWVVRNWKAWLPLISGVTAALGLYRGVMAVIIPMQQAFNILTKANPWVAAASIIAGAAAAIYGYASNTQTAAEELKELNRELDKNLQKNREREQTANRYLDSLKNQNTSEERRIRLLEELKKLYPSIFEGMKVEQAMLEDTIGLKKRMADATKEMTLADYDAGILKKQNEIDRLRQEDWKRLTTPGRGDKHSQNDARIKELNSDITALKEKRESLSKELEWKVAVEGLNDKSTLEDYISLYGEIGKAIKILRDNGINDEVVVKPEQGIPLDEYYDRLESALKKQENIKKKFNPDSVMHKSAEGVAKIYRLAIEAIDGVWKKDSGGGSKGKSEAEKAAERDAKAYLDALKERMKGIGSQWDLFKELMEATGDRKLSMNLSGLGGLDFKDELEHLKSEMTKELQKNGINLSAGEVLGMNFDEVAKKVDDKEKLKRIKEIYDTYHDANRSLRMETIKDFAEIIKASRDFEAKIAEIDRKLQEDLIKLRKTSAEGGVDLKSEEFLRAEKHLKEKAEQDKANERFEEFKASSDWVKVFDDLDRVATPTLDTMLDKMESFIYQIEESPEAMKEMLDAIGKMREKLSERDPFGMFSRSLEKIRNINAARWLLAGNESYVFQQDLYGFKAGQKVTAKSLDDMEKDVFKNFSLAIGDTSKAFDNLQNILKPLIDLFGDGAGVVGKFLDGIGDALGAASSMSNNLSSLMSITIGEGDSVASKLGIKNAGMWGAIAGAGLSIAGSLMKAFGADYSSYNKMKEEYDNLLGVWDSLIDRKREYIDIDYADEARKVGQEALDILDKQIEAYRTLGKERLNAGASLGSHSIGYRIKDDMSEEGWEQFRNAAKSIGFNAAKVEEGRMEGLFNLTADQLAKLQEKAPVFWAKLDEDVRTYLEDIIASNEALEEMKDMLNETLTGVSLDSFYDNYISMLSDLDKSNQDFAQSFEEYLKNAIIANLMGSKYRGQIDNLYNQWASYSDSDGDGIYDLTPQEADDLKKAYNGLTDQMLEDRDNLSELFGWDNLKSGVEGLSKGIQGVSEDTANLLASYINSVRQDVSMERTLIEQLVASDVPRINYLVEAQLTQLNAIAANTLRNANAADKIYDLMNRMSDKGSNKWRI